MNEAMQAEKIKGFIGCVSAVLSYLYGSFNELMAVLVILMLSDYLLGITVGLLYDGFDYKKGILGTVKKAGYMLLVTLAFLMDYSIGFVGKTDTKGMFGYAVTCYLIGTEGLSVLRLLSRLGLPVPDFLSRAFGALKDKAEQSGDGTENATE